MSEKIVEMLKSYLRGLKYSNPCIGQYVLEEIYKRLKRLPDKALEHVFNIINSNKKDFPEDFVKEVESEYKARKR
jgi:hypothetical protein